jgi:hypothetical protein
MTGEIVDLDAYRVSFVAQTRTRLRKAGRPPRRRRRNSAEDVVVDLFKQRDDPPKPHMPKSRHRWRTMPQPARYVPDCYPTVGEARQLAEWLLDGKRGSMITYVESRCAEIVIEKADAGQIVTRGERSRLLKTVNRVRACYAEDPLDGWQPSATM